MTATDARRLPDRRTAGPQGPDPREPVRRAPGREAPAQMPAPAPAPVTAAALRAEVAFILRSTQQRPQTEAEIRMRLRSREVPPPVADAAVAEAKRVGAIDDVTFARIWIEDRGQQRGYGALRLRQELQRRLVPDDVIEDAVRRLDDRDDEAVATELAADRAQRYPPSTPPERVAGRLVGFLARRGYPEGLARTVAFRVSGLDRDWD